MKDRFGEWLRRLANWWHDWLERRAIEKNIHDFERRKINEDAGQSKARKKAREHDAREKRNDSRSGS